MSNKSVQILYGKREKKLQHSAMMHVCLLLVDKINIESVKIIFYENLIS